MLCHFWQACLVVLGLGVAATCCGQTASRDRAAGGPIANSLADAMRDDAQLSDVVFVDAEYGWAVGDRGVIWHTRDGGSTWKLQKSGVEFPLTSVHFIDKLNGWAAGGQTDPWLHTSRGAVLRTRDGGKTWRPTAELLLPAIRRIKFFDALHGCALTRHSDLFSGGVFHTADGGCTWTPFPGSQSASWQAADFFDAERGAAITHNGLPKMIGRKGVGDARSPDIGSRRTRSMRLQSDGRGWLVADDAMVLQTADHGSTWQAPACALPEQLAPLLELAAIATCGDHVWIAGAPGTRILHSADFGRTWQTFSTGQSLPIAALHFVDARRGWAVGSLGTIFATRDGGRSWMRQRGGTRAAYLAVFDRPDAVPLEVIAQLSAEEGYYGVLQLVADGEVTSQQFDHIHSTARLHEAAALCGASAAILENAFPAKPRQLEFSAAKIVEEWNCTHDGRAIERLEELLVRRIRTWRPDVVLTSRASPRGEDALAHIVNQVTLRAVASAADPTRFAEHAQHAALESWQVKKVFSSLAPGQAGTVNVSGSTLGARLEKSLTDYAARSRALLGAAHDAPETLGFQLAINRLADAVGRRDFFSGIHLAHGEGARRRLVEPTAESVALLRRRVVLQRALQQLFAADGQQPGEAERWLAQAGEMAGELEHSSAAALLYRLAERYHRTGRWELAAETMRTIVDRYGGQPQAAAAAQWLLVYYASSEAAWRSRGKQRFAVREATAEVARGGRAEAQQADFLAETPAGAEPRSTDLQATAANLSRRAVRAAAVGTHLARMRPEVYARPDLRFPLAAAYRQQGDLRLANQILQAVKIAGGDGACAMCADAELRLGQGRPLQAWTCSRTSDRPYLDGRLDDDVWKHAESVPLRLEGHREQTTGSARLAYDSEFLYFAVTCMKARGVNSDAAKHERTRDAALGGRDRVELLLDIDRDRSTYYRLAVDDRGFCHDSLWGDATWNPQWFVARGGDEKTWVIEAAIEWNELVDSAPKPRHVWAAQLQRITPGVGFQSWSTPASPAVEPAGFGLLMFK
jgi:photosystem II stability/assembly factor-like uncharacterized protein